jgi:putative colanic acid biosynthesis acetyltransferase WcaF
MRVPLRAGQITWRNRFGRIAWGAVWTILYRPTPAWLHSWRCLLLRAFGARIGRGVHVYPSSRVWAPWNLVMKAHSCLSHHVDCYNVDHVSIGAYAIVSQHSTLCTATHDYADLSMPLVTGPIAVGDRSWVTARVFVGPGVRIGDGAVVLANSTVIRDVERWTVVAGCPARFVKRRVARDASATPEVKAETFTTAAE